MTNYQYKYEKYRQKYQMLKYNKFISEAEKEINSQTGGFNLPFRSKGNGVGKIDLDNIKSLSGQPRLSSQHKNFRKFLKWAYRGLKLGTSAAATGLSMGAAGDTIPDIIFLMLDTSFLTANIRQLAYIGKDVYPYVKYMMAIPWEGDPEKVRVHMEQMFIAIDNDPNAKEIYGHLCLSFSQILDTLAAVVGSAITTFIPDDAGVTRFAIETVIADGRVVAGRSPYDFLKWGYSKIPEKGRALLGDKEKFVDFFLHIIAYVRNLMPNKKDSFWTKVKKNLKRIGMSTLLTYGLFLVPGGILLFGPVMSAQLVGNVMISFGLSDKVVSDLFDNHIIPYVPKYVYLIQRSIMLSFATLILLQHCGV